VTFLSKNGSLAPLLTDPIAAKIVPRIDAAVSALGPYDDSHDRGKVLCVAMYEFRKVALHCGFRISASHPEPDTPGKETLTQLVFQRTM